MGLGSFETSYFTSYFTSSATPAIDTSESKPKNLLPFLGSGHFNVGCADLMANAANSGDLNALNSVFARVFYPSELKLKTDISTSVEVSAQSQPEFPSWRPRDEYIEGLADYREMSAQKMRFFFDWIIGERRVPAGWHLPLFKHHTLSSTSTETSETQCQKFPVVLFSHGISGNRFFYSTFCSSLASYGFIVVALEHRDRSASWSFFLEKDSASGEIMEKQVQITKYPPDEQEFELRNEQVNVRAAESINAMRLLDELNSGRLSVGEEEADKMGYRPEFRVVLGQDFDWSQFEGRLDNSRVAFIGHSFGGASAVASTALIPTSPERRVCSVVLDGWLYPFEEDLYDRLNYPTLFLNASKWQWAKNVQRMLRIIDNKSRSMMFTLRDIVHQSFSDFSYLSPGYIGKYLGLQGEHHPNYTGTAVLDMVVEFLRGQLGIAENANNASEVKTTLQRIKRIVEERYAHFVFEGTDIDVEKEEGKGENESNEEQIKREHDASEATAKEASSTVGTSV